MHNKLHHKNLHQPKEEQIVTSEMETDGVSKGGMDNKKKWGFRIRNNSDKEWEA